MNVVEGKIAIISGAGSGMGIEHVRALVGGGAKVLGFDITPGQGPQLIEQLGKDKFQFFTGSVVAEIDWIFMVNECKRLFGPPSILVNNAGILGTNRVESVSEQEYRKVVDVNQIGPYLGMRSVIDSMRKAGGGSIVNVSSTAGMVAYEDNFAYIASKWAVRGMTKAAAIELACEGIRVNAVCPGETETPMLLNSSAPGTSLPPDSFPFGRWAQPREVTAAVLFLASDQSSYISGTEIVVDGAYTAA